MFFYRLENWLEDHHYTISAVMDTACLALLIVFAKVGIAILLAFLAGLNVQIK